MGLPIIILVGLLLYSRGRNAGQNAVNSFSYDLHSFNRQGPNLVVTIRLHNPTDAAVSIKSINLFAKYQGNVVAQFSNTNLPTIPANGSVNVPLKARLNVIGSAQALLSALMQGIKKQVQLEGTVVLPNISVPVNKTMAWT